MIDLKLNVMEEDKPFSYEEFISATNEYYEAMEELTSAEQELFEVNRACENLVALQDIVAKHGWSAVLNDLIGNQISSETLDASCEGAFDKIKQVASKIGSKLTNVLQKAFNLFDVYVKRFKAAKEWLKKNKDAKASTESYNGNMYSSDIKADMFIEIGNVVKFFDKATSYITGYQNRNQSLRDYVIKELNSYSDGGYYLSKCSNEELVKLCDDVINHLPKLKQILQTAKHNAANSRKAEKLEQKRVNDTETDMKQTQSIREAAMYEKHLNKHKENLESISGYRYGDVIRKVMVHVAIQSCKHLDAEIRKRGYKSEFTV